MRTGRGLSPPVRTCTDPGTRGQQSTPGVGRGPSRALRAGTATTLAVVATDARLDKAGCSKLAGVAHDGFARALSPVHTAFDGDTVFALSTPGGVTPTPFDVVELQTAAADCVSRAIARAVLAAGSVDRSEDGGAVLPGYRETLSRR